MSKYDRFGDSDMNWLRQETSKAPATAQKPKPQQDVPKRPVEQAGTK